MTLKPHLCQRSQKRKLINPLQKQRKTQTFQHKCLKESQEKKTGKGSKENFSRSENGKRSNKTQTKGILEIENLAEQTGITESSINRVQEMEERIPSIKDMIEENDLLIEKS